MADHPRQRLSPLHVPLRSRAPWPRSRARAPLSGSGVGGLCDRQSSGPLPTPKERHCLRARSDAPGERLRPARRTAGDEGRILACAQCRQPITTTAARMEVEGAHEHAFVNPAAIRFRIGCFACAPGCVAVGEESTYWSWFPPCSWQIEHCASCREHLGWLFRCPDRIFHGLILDRLQEAEP
jgi:hypothetical protein